ISSLLACFQSLCWCAAGRSGDTLVVAPDLRVPVARPQNPARQPAALCPRSNSCRAFPSPVPAARASVHPAVVRRRRRLHKRPPPGHSWPQPPALRQLNQTRVGFFEAEAIRLHRSEFFQSSIDALETLVKRCAQQIPGPCRLTRAGLGQHLNSGFHQNRIGHRGAVSLPPQHQPVAGWTAAKLRWRSAAATEADRHEVIFSSFLNVQDSNIPLPQIQGVSDVKELFLSAQFEFVQAFRSCFPAEAVELLTVDTNDIAEIAVPPEDGAKYFVEFWELQLIGDRYQADDHWADLAQNRSQNQAFEGDCFNHLSRLLGPLDPRLLAALHPRRCPRTSGLREDHIREYGRLSRWLA